MRRLSLAVLAGGLSALAVLSTHAPELRVEPGTPAWTRLVRGTTPNGIVRTNALVTVPGWPRDVAGQLTLEAASLADAPATLQVGLDGGSRLPFAVRQGPPVVIALPSAWAPGFRLALSADASAPVRLAAVVVSAGGSRPWLAGLLAGIAAGGLAWVLARVGSTALALGLALFAGGTFALARAPAFVFLAQPAAWPRLALAIGMLATGALVALRLSRPERRLWLRGATLVSAFVFGLWVRLFFLPSTGSWDTEYWKAWMFQALDHGLAQSFGPAEAMPAGHALAQARGEEALWKVEWRGRRFVVDYPPLAMASWSACWHALRLLWPGMDPLERENVAVKLPPVLGDVAGVIVLWIALRPDRRRALTIAALYWALPISWLSSAVLGFLDGALAPFAAASLVDAGRGNAARAGIWLAVASLFKPTALIVAPAIVVALWLWSREPGRNPWRSLAAATLAGVGVVAVAFLPFLFEGTLVTALVHCYRILFQERLSGGYPNLWWLAGHAIQVGAGAAPAGPVQYAHVSLIPFPVRPIGTLLFALLAILVVRAQRAGVAGASLAGAALFLFYGLVAIGVHENHPHPLFLMLLATGLTTRGLRWVTAGAAVVYVGDMLSLSALGRFHGPRYVYFEPLWHAAETWRMALGFDLTLALTAVNLAACAALVVVMLRGSRQVMPAIPART